MAEVSGNSRSAAGVVICRCMHMCGSPTSSMAQMLVTATATLGGQATAGHMPFYQRYGRMQRARLNCFHTLCKEQVQDPDQ